MQFMEVRLLHGKFFCYWTHDLEKLSRIGLRNPIIRLSIIGTRRKELSMPSTARKFSPLSSGHRLVGHSHACLHGLINYTDTKAFVGFSLIDLQENFPALIYHPSRRKCIHLQTGGWGSVANSFQDNPAKLAK
jgi:hypothetical protein